MENERCESVEEKIRHFMLRKDEKEKLLFFSECIIKNRNSKENNIVVTIDNMPINEIRKLIRYIEKVLQLNGMKGTIEKRKPRESYQKSKSDIIWLNFDFDELSWCLHNDSYELISKVRDILSDNYILIISSVLPLNKIESFEKSNLLEVFPHISFHGEIDEFAEYKKLANKYKNNNIKYEMKLDDFSRMISNINENNYIKTCRISDYLYDYSTKNYSTIFNNYV